MSLRNGGDPSDWLAFAMCRWDAGDRAGAQQWYDKSKDWMSRNPSLASDPDMRSLLGEMEKRLSRPAAPGLPRPTSSTPLDRDERNQPLREFHPERQLLASTGRFRPLRRAGTYQWARE
jgi:hypothetical protein